MEFVCAAGHPSLPGGCGSRGHKGACPCLHTSLAFAEDKKPTGEATQSPATSEAKSPLTDDTGGK